jgi:Rod binding domain-containing protein
MSATEFQVSVKHTHPTDRHTELVKQTEKWVSQTFYGALLKQMRNSPFKSEMFDGGRGGEAFNSMFDQQLADRMSRSAGGKLVNAIVAKIEHRQSHSKGAHSGAKPLTHQGER